MDRPTTVVCVLDMDETLGSFDKETFHVRPRLQTLIDLLRLTRIDIVLWSLGGDEYVHRVVNGFLPEIARHAHKVFARRECDRSYERYQYYKASEHIRVMYDHCIFLIGVDDKVSQNMDSQYDLRISIRPYKKPDPTDRALLDVCEKIIQGVMKFYDERENSCPPNDYDDGDAFLDDSWIL